MPQFNIDTLAPLIDSPATASDLGISPYQRRVLTSNGIVKVRETQKTGQRGRPAFVLALTDKGRKRVKRSQHRQAQPAAS